MHRELWQLVGRPAPSDGTDHVYHVYAIATDDRDTLRRALTDAGIATNIHYPRPAHLQPAYAEFANGPGSFPVAEALAARTLSLPIFPELTLSEVAQVASAVNALCPMSVRRVEEAVA